MAARKPKNLGLLLGRRIRELREASGWQQADLAAAIDDDVSRSLVSYFETGKSFPRPNRLEAIARALGVEVAALFLDPRIVQHRLALAALRCKDRALIKHVGKMMDVDV